jgi:hypothetical protein
MYENLLIILKPIFLRNSSVYYKFNKKKIKKFLTVLMS